MYYYKKVNEANEVEYVEMCVHEKANLGMNLVEISGGEYERLLQAFNADDDSEKNIEQSEIYQAGYEQALLDMAEVGV